MNEYELKYSNLISNLKILFKKIDAVYLYFLNEDKYIKQIPLQHKKLSGLRTLVERASNKSLNFEKLKPGEIKAELNDIEILLKDSKKILSEIIIEIEKITGKKIKFRSEIK